MKFATLTRNSTECCQDAQSNEIGEVGPCRQKAHSNEICDLGKEFLECSQKAQTNEICDLVCVCLV